MGLPQAHYGPGRPTMGLPQAHSGPARPVVSVMTENPFRVRLPALGRRGWRGEVRRRSTLRCTCCTGTPAGADHGPWPTIGHRSPCARRRRRPVPGELKTPEPILKAASQTAFKICCGNAVPPGTGRRLRRAHGDRWPMVGHGPWSATAGVPVHVHVQRGLTLKTVENPVPAESG